MPPSTILKSARSFSFKLPFAWPATSDRRPRHARPATDPARRFRLSVSLTPRHQDPHGRTKLVKAPHSPRSRRSRADLPCRAAAPCRFQRPGTTRGYRSTLLASPVSAHALTGSEVWLKGHGGGGAQSCSFSDERLCHGERSSSGCSTRRKKRACRRYACQKSDEAALLSEEGLRKVK